MLDVGRSYGGLEANLFLGLASKVSLRPSAGLTCEGRIGCLESCLKEALNVGAVKLGATVNPIGLRAFSLLHQWLKERNMRLLEKLRGEEGME